jgi:hypothetical protein
MDDVATLRDRQSYVQTALSNVKTNLAERAVETQQRAPLGKRNVKKRKVRAKKPEKKFKPWTNPGDACFIIVYTTEGDWTKGIHFQYDDKHKNLWLTSGSRTEKLLTGLKGKYLTSDQIKADMGKGRTKASDVVTYANKLLNDKIRGIGFTGLPNYEVAFIALNIGRYESAIPIYTKDEFGRKEIEQVTN